MNKEKARSIVNGVVSASLLVVFLWIALTIYLLPIKGNKVYLLLVGTIVWGAIWIATGAAIGWIAALNGLWKTWGLVFGGVVGTLAGIILVVWPACSESDLLSWAVRSSIDLPTSSILYLFNANGLARLGLSYQPLGIPEIITTIVTSIVIWGIFGLLTAILA